MYEVKGGDGEWFDTIVIGGGITGAAVARELARAGVSVLLLEAMDFGSGTTSRTSRLQYCGLAYLRNFARFRNILQHPIEFITALRLARRSMIGRRRFLTTHPHRLRPVPFQLPIFEGEGLSLGKLKLAMRVMSLLDPASPFEWQLLGPESAKRLPFLKGAPKPLTGAVVYYDYQYVWPERVCIDVIEEAKALGAVAYNYTPVVSLAKVGRDWSVKYEDKRSVKLVNVRASSVINCSGPWIDELPDLSGLKVEKLNAGEKGANIMVRLPKLYKGLGLQVSTEEDGTFLHYSLERHALCGASKHRDGYQR